MGIPHLWSTVQPYARHNVFAAESGEMAKSARRRAVIDGPSLVYAALRNALPQKEPGHVDDDVHCLPSYMEITARVIEFLDLLVLHGFDISAVYFDGALPEHKRDTRIQRLQSHINTLSLLRGRSASQSNPNKLPNLAKTNLAPPFLVPAAIEQLWSSRYGCIVSVVTSEADVACASDVHVNGGYVFTTDSDLLVFDLGQRGHVIVPSAITYVQQTESSELHAPVHSPGWVAKHLSLKCLVSLAHALSRKPTAPLQSVKLEAQKVDRQPSKKFNAFRQNYMFEETTNTQAKVNHPGSMLDPRISEWYCQVRAKAYDTQAEVYHFYPPTLLDDPQQVSPWSMTQSMRQLAYSLLLPGSPRSPGALTVEAYRRGLKTPQVEVPHLNRAALAQELGTWVAAMHGFFGDLAEHKTGLLFKSTQGQACQWRGMAVSIVLRNLDEAGKLLPLAATVSRLILGDEKATDWHYLHSMAQTQAVLYSFRMLKQLLVVHSHDINEASGSDQDDLGNAAKALERLLARMPDLASLHPPQPANLSTTVLKTLVAAVYKFAGLESKRETASITSTVNNPGKSSTKRKNDRSQLRKSQPKVAKSSNPFGLLETLQ